MKVTPEHNERVAKLTFGGVYPHYVTKVVKKGRTEEELRQVIEWLTGYDAELIKGVICGYRIEQIDNTLTRQARYLDKLVDELAKGRKMEKILRTV